MQVNETVSDGLKREFQVNVPAADIEAKVDARLDDMKDKVKLNGFRPGKVPDGPSEAPLWPLGGRRDRR